VTDHSDRSPETRSSPAAAFGEIEGRLSSLPRPVAGVLCQGVPSLHGRPDLRGPALPCDAGGAARDHRACAF